ncbi:MAG: hypothetical protein WCE94_14670 [Candidatus Methanoperedens sp.]
MDDLTIKEKILKSLLESPKTTGKIALELGYVDKKTKYPRYNIINSDLNTLESYGFIHRVPSNQKSPGAPATTFDVVYEISALSKILEKYPVLISDLQKNIIVSNLLVKKQQWLANPNLPKEEDLKQLYDIDCKQQWLAKLNLLREEDLQKLRIIYSRQQLEVNPNPSTLEEEIINFKLFLKFSPTFFKMCLMSSPEELLRIILSLDRRPVSEYPMNSAEYINLVTPHLEPPANQPIWVNRFEFSNGRPLYTLIRACIFTDTLTNKDKDDVKYAFVQQDKIDEAHIKIKNENDGTKYVLFEMEYWGFRHIDKILAEIDKTLKK